MDDNLYPKSGYRPSEPTLQQIEKAKEAAQVQKALPLIQDILDRFAEKIEFYKSVDSVPEEVLTFPDEFMHYIATNKLVASMLQAELDYLNELVEVHKGD